MCCYSLGLVRMETDDLIFRYIPPNYRAGCVLIGGLLSMLSFGNVYTFG